MILHEKKLYISYLPLTFQNIHKTRLILDFPQEIKLDLLQKSFFDFKIVGCSDQIEAQPKRLRYCDSAR